MVQRWQSPHHINSWTHQRPGLVGSSWDTAVESCQLPLHALENEDCCHGGQQARPPFQKWAPKNYHIWRGEHSYHSSASYHQGTRHQGLTQNQLSRQGSKASVWKNPLKPKCHHFRIPGVKPWNAPIATKPLEKHCGFFGCTCFLLRL